MSHPDMEALLMRELDAAAREQAQTHGQACKQCGREQRLLERERALFADRARLLAQPTPDFSTVARALPAQRKVRARAYRGMVMFAMTALLLVVNPLQHNAAPTDEAGGMCGASWPMAGWCASDAVTAGELAVAETEASFGACLVATPG